MPFDTPSLPKLIERVSVDLSNKSTSSLRRADRQVLARTHAGASHGLHGHLSWNAKQILPDTADEEMLIRQGRLRLRQQRKDASSAFGTATVKGKVGAIVDEDVLMQSEDGRRYRVTSSVRLGAVSSSVEVEAMVAGSDGNLPAGAKLSMVSPVLDVEDDGVVNAPGISGGSQQETIEEYRQRVMRSYQRVPHGGNAGDYVDWALEVPGVTRAWCVRAYMGPGTVGVFFMRDNDDEPVPDENEIKLVADHINAVNVRPVTAEIYVQAPPQVRVAFVIELDPDSSVTRAAVEASLRDLLKREEEGAAAIPQSEVDKPRRIPLTHIAEAISGSPGEYDHKLIKPTTDIILPGHAIAIFGGITWG
ncbi:baseplate J/gp47 family protein [Collimonas sp. H4R21]|jgi:uncharacterized phage protein gp47/JayE|uniref:Baseplate J/gp47 family protein n=1 Tax=Collimonas rhizosphaerae TaxID=3126357 RepID=A0ABU9PXV2_9BURK